MTQRSDVTCCNAVDVLSSRAFRPVRYRARHRALAERLGLDFRFVLHALTCVPLCLDGAEHARRRQSVARLMAARKEIVASAIPGIVENRFALFHKAGRFDLMEACVVPAVDDVIETLVGTRTQLARDSLISRIFSQSMGVSRRKRMELEIRALHERLSEAFPDDDRDRLESRVAIAILGRDALIGTLGCSLHAALKARAQCPTSPVSFPRVPTQTGVPYVDRVARTGVDIAGKSFAEGDVARCRLSSLSDSPARDRLRFFGAGAHLCLGKPVSLDLFREVSDVLGKITAPVDILQFNLRRDDVFNIPETFTVEIVQ